MCGKCRILRFQIVGAHIIWLVGTKVLVRTYCLHNLMSCEDRSRMLLMNIHPLNQTIQCLNSDCIMNPHHSEHLIFCIKNIKNN